MRYTLIAREYVTSSWDVEAETAEEAIDFVEEGKIRGERRVIARVLDEIVDISPYEPEQVASANPGT